MRKIAIILLVMFLHTTPNNAQVKYDYNWALGHDSNLADSTFGGTDISFNESQISLTYTFREVNIEQTNVTMSDADGNLLFYSNGCKVFNRNHVLMENGDSINPGEVFDNQCEDAYPIIQGILAIPIPQNDSLYYILHQRMIFKTNPFDIRIDKLLYSVINSNMDSGLGEVIEKNVIAIPDTLAYGELTAVKHANGIDWWIISPRFLENKYYTLLITSNGLSGLSEQIIGDTTTRSGEGSGQTTFSPNGTKYVRYNMTDQVYLFDFDRSTGQLSNYQHLMVADTAHLGGATFSPSSRYLYISSSFYVYQFDTWAADIQASKIVVATYDGFEDPFPTYFQLMQMGPDCRIYINSGSSHRSFHVINQPDELGLACDLQQHSLRLPTDNFAAMPHFPNYRLGTTPTYPCDPTIDLPVALTEVKAPDLDFTLSPNPTSGIITLRFTKGVQSIRITNTLGQTIHRWNNLEMHDHWTMPDLDLSNGLYFCTVESTNTQQTKSFLIIR